MRSNDIQFAHVSTYGPDRFGKDIDVQAVRNNNPFSDYDDDNNDLLYHLDSISSMPDPYLNKQWNQQTTMIIRSKTCMDH
mmetsp:Transcript_7328/g.7915  ORF Transcript_7328/g.7915 Transcript_7328/m.7915 type:complete len:80 (+) Transcript_7328:1-240(+)